MKRDELVRLHQLLSHVKDYLQEVNPALTFPQYATLKITPSQHYTKREQTYAIFVLGMEIAEVMKGQDSRSSSRIVLQLKVLAEKSRHELERQYGPGLP